MLNKIYEQGLPDFAKDTERIYVSDKHLFVYLNNNGINVSFLGHVQGYNDMFIRHAYRNGLAYDYFTETSEYLRGNKNGKKRKKIK